LDGRQQHAGDARSSRRDLDEATGPGWHWCCLDRAQLFRDRFGIATRLPLDEKEIAEDPGEPGLPPAEGLAPE
jgi:hypothetical protein